MVAANLSMPRSDWSGVSRIVVVCRASIHGAPENATDSTRLHDTLCAAVAANAATGTALPVSSVRFGDPAMFDRGSLVLLVNASARPDAGGVGGGRLVTFAIRPWRAIAGDENDLFGDAPQAVRVPVSGSGTELEPAIGAALDRILPWRHRQD